MSSTEVLFGTTENLVKIKCQIRIQLKSLRHKEKAEKRPSSHNPVPPDLAVMVIEHKKMGDKHDSILNTSANTSIFAEQSSVTDPLECSDEVMTGIQEGVQTGSQVKSPNSEVEKNTSKRGRGRLRKQKQTVEVPQVREHKCKLCDKVFDQKGIVKRHITMKHPDSRLKCNLCETSFTVEDDLTKHVKSKHKPIECNECPRTFRTMAGFKLHKSGSHKNANAHPRRSVAKPETTSSNACKFLCEICNQSFRSKHEQLEHSLEVHEVKSFEEAHACSTCHKIFATKRRLISHSIVHSSEHRYLCTHCGKTFKRVGHLNDHLDLHSPEPKYQCNVCGKKITTKSNLSSHMYMHKAVRDHTCEYCGKAFKNNTKLKAHVDIHLNERRHKCEFCGKGFNHNGTLWLHRKNVHKASKAKVTVEAVLSAD